MKYTAVLALAFLSGCAQNACKSLPQVALVQPEPEIITRTVVVHDKVPARGAILLKAYKGTETQQNHLASTGSAPAITKLIQLRLAVREAFAPLQVKGHKPTDAEVAKAIAAYGDLQAFLKEPHATRKKEVDESVLSVPHSP